MKRVKVTKPVEVEIENIRVSDFFDKRFVEALESEFKGVKFEHFCFYLKDAKSKKKSVGERISIGHPSKKDEGRKLANIHTSKPETLTRVIKVVQALE